MNDTAASDLLRAGHRKFEKHLDSLLEALKHLNAERVADIRRDFAALQKPSHVHFEQEERIFYPAVRTLAQLVLAQMEEEHSTVRETEQGLEEMLADLFEMLPETPTQRDLGELYRLGIEFHDAVEVHIVDEEDYLLTLADRVLSSDQQQDLAAGMLNISNLRSEETSLREES